MSLQHTCPICGDGALHEISEHDEISYKGSTRVVPFYLSVCQNCGCEQATAEQTRANKRAVIAAKKDIDGLLSSGEIRRIREFLKLTQAEAGNIFGGGPTAFSKYESNDVAQSKSMDTLIRLAFEMPLVADRLVSSTGTTSIAETDRASLTTQLLTASIIDMKGFGKKYWEMINTPERPAYRKVLFFPNLEPLKEFITFDNWRSVKELHTEYAINEVDNYSSGYEPYVRTEKKELH